jgi:hypothetical protein
MRFAHVLRLRGRELGSCCRLWCIHSSTCLTSTGMLPEGFLPMFVEHVCDFETTTHPYCWMLPRRYCMVHHG